VVRRVFVADENFFTPVTTVYKRRRTIRTFIRARTGQREFILTFPPPPDTSITHTHPYVIIIITVANGSGYRLAARVGQTTITAGVVL